MTSHRRYLPALDVVLVLLFAVLGRRSHDESGGLLGVLGTAWPFLVGTAVGWVLVRRLSRRDAVALGPGITVWVCTLVIGMLLRAITGAGTALPFIIVATLVLALFLLGWRALYPFVLARLAERQITRDAHTQDDTDESDDGATETESASLSAADRPQD